MSLSAGDKLGPYEILGLIGAGGMGEVYKARDPRLGRDVAIKVSAAQFTERFDREARAVASLNHPNICHLYDVGPNYLVMELVGGESPQGPLPLEEALRIARQIGDALEAAHEKGITHRDMKPANIKVKPDGTVKVLDFGLAKQSRDSDGTVSENSPTLSMAATQVGMILGTAGYMSPEQARGKPVDKRADIWAFGVVLHEMLTGQRLFQGEDVSHTMAAVIMQEPNLEVVPVQVRKLLRRCLEKDPKKRLRDIADAMALVEESGPVPQVSSPAKSRTYWIWPAVAAAFMVAFALVSFFHFREQLPASELDRFQIPAPEKSSFGNYVNVSPDGRKVAFDAIGADGRNHLWIRPLDSLQARIVADLSNNGPFPFWSPDSRFLGFQADGKLKKVDIAGGSPQTLCDLPGQFRGGAWNLEGVIVFSMTGGGLRQLPEAGGTPAAVTISQTEIQAAPSFLPDGRHFVYLRYGVGPDHDGIYLGSLGTKPEQQSSKRLLATLFKPVYVPYRESSKKGYILYVRESTLVAQPFDTERMDLDGEGVPIAEQIARTNSLTAVFSASSTGVLAYETGSGSSRHLTWYDRQGKMLDSAGQPGDYQSLALSPDGTRVAVERRDPGTGADLWLMESARTAAGTRFTFDPGRDFTPVWSPDGNRVAFMSQREGGVNLYVKLSSMGGNEEALFKSSEFKYLDDWSRDGRYMLFSGADSKTGFNLWVLPAAGKQTGAKPEPFLVTKFDETQGKFSPDGKWIVYTSSESGGREIYVRPFPAAPAGGVVQVSSGGGSQPRWSRDGKEIFYLSGQKLMAAQVSTSPVFKSSPAKPLFDTAVAVPSANLWAWDVDPTGQKFLINTQAGESASSSITVVLNWETALRK